MTYVNCLWSICVIWVLIVPAMWIGMFVTVAICCPVMGTGFWLLQVPFTLAAVAANLFWASYYFSFFGGLSVSRSCGPKKDNFQFLSNLMPQARLFQFDRRNWLVGLKLLLKTILVFFSWCLGLQIPILIGSGSENLVIAIVFQILWIPIFMTMVGGVTITGGLSQLPITGLRATTLRNKDKATKEVSGAI